MALSKVGNNLQLMPTDRITPRFNVVQLLAPANSFISISGEYYTLLFHFFVIKGMQII